MSDAQHYRTKEEVEKMREQVTPLLETIPGDGTNTIIVGHDDPFEAATGIYPEPQGVIFVIRPKKDGFDVIGKVDPGDWPKILAEAK